MKINGQRTRREPPSPSGSLRSTGLDRLETRSTTRARSRDDDAPIDKRTSLMISSPSKTAIISSTLTKTTEIQATGRSWENSRVELALADDRNADALRTAFMGVAGVFVMILPKFAPEPAFPETRAIVTASRQALDAAKSGKAVDLSSIIRSCIASICVDRVRTAESSRGNLTPSMLPVNFHSTSPSYYSWYRGQPQAACVNSGGKERFMAYPRSTSSPRVAAAWRFPTRPA
jgi:hypothetical protein